METVLTGVVVVVVSGAIIFLAKHTVNESKHIGKDGAVGEDLCDARMKATDDCFEAKIDGLEQLVKSEFENVKELIRNNH